MEAMTIYRGAELTASITPTAAELQGRFIKYLDAAPKTIETYARSLRQFVKYMDALGLCFPPSRDNIIEYREALKADGKTPSTIQGYITAVRLFLAWAMQEGYISNNPAEHIKSAKVSRNHKRDYFTAEQAGDIIEGIDTDTLQGMRDKAICALMAVDGLRTVSIINADVGDLRTVGGAVVLYVQGKGHEAKDDISKITPETERLTRRYLTARGKVDSRDPLFASISDRNNGGRLTTRSVSRIAKERMRDAGFDSATLTAHSLRHTAAMAALHGGADIVEIKDFLHHSNISTTQIYIDHGNNLNNSCAAIVAAAIFGRKEAAQC